LLFPIAWPEPFGLVMIEAMACGTPVLAFRHGSTPEVVDDGVTGYVVDGVDEAICKMGSLLALDRGRVRRRFEERFTAGRMARDYVAIYRQLLRAKQDRTAPTILGREKTSKEPVLRVSSRALASSSKASLASGSSGVEAPDAGETSS
jgi:hypothetical protein